jgi:hypothetical protein
MEGYVMYITSNKKTTHLFLFLIVLLIPIFSVGMEDAGEDKETLSDRFTRRI